MSSHCHVDVLWLRCTLGAMGGQRATRNQSGGREGFLEKAMFQL